MVCCGKTELSAQELLKETKTIEVAIGRQPSFRNGPRPIDIDILLYDDIHIEQEVLTIPHPRMYERAFVLVPLAEISPNVIDPLSGKTAQELADALPRDGINILAPNLRIALDRDIQNSSPSIHVRLGRAGVVGVKKALLLGAGNRQQWSEATFDLYADLDTKRAGVHMSRFSDVLEEVLEEKANASWPKIELLAEAVAQALVERQVVSRAEVHIRTALPLQKWTPVSGRRTQEVYGLLTQAVATRYGSRRLLGVEVEGMVACPCAQDMVRSFTRMRLQEEGFQDNAIEKMLSITPLATHNQRGRATLLIGTEQDIEAGDLVALVENAMSSENYALLKRPDELYIVNKAHANPHFVEDVVREVLNGVINMYTNLPDDTFVWVHQRNEETIHKYDVDAEGWGTLGELRSEVVQMVDIAHHTSKEEWLGAIEQTKR
ncbi:MAG: hypothetical protein PVSMB2_12010 [Ktedonobacteraceae bacterium]